MWCGSSGSVVHRQMLSRGGIPIRATIYINNMYEYMWSDCFLCNEIESYMVDDDGVDVYTFLCIISVYLIIEVACGALRSIALTNKKQIDK